MKKLNYKKITWTIQYASIVIASTALLIGIFKSDITIVGLGLCSLIPELKCIYYMNRYDGLTEIITKPYKQNGEK